MFTQLQETSRCISQPLTHKETHHPWRVCISRLGTSALTWLHKEKCQGALREIGFADIPVSQQTSPYHRFARSRCCSQVKVQMQWCPFLKTSAKARETDSGMDVVFSFCVKPRTREVEIELFPGVGCVVDLKAAGRSQDCSLEPFPQLCSRTREIIKYFCSKRRMWVSFWPNLSLLLP
jgi:hypothetical protein